LAAATSSIIQLETDKKLLLGHVKALEDQLFDAEGGLQRSQEELFTLNRDLAALEKAMDMNHSNLVVGASSNSCVGLAELKEKEIVTLRGIFFRNSYILFLSRFTETSIRESAVS
jgi:hypothetical protein